MKIEKNLPETTSASFGPQVTETKTNKKTIQSQWINS